MGRQLGGLIQQARKEHRLMQGDLAEQLKTTQATVSAWESGRFDPKPEALAALIRALQLDTREVDDAIATDNSEFGGSSDPTVEYLQKTLPVEQFRDLTICLLAVNALPTAQSQRVRNRMANLLRRGAQFRFIWFSDVAKAEDLSWTVRSLKLLLEPLRSPTRSLQVVHFCDYLRDDANHPSQLEFQKLFKEYCHSDIANQIFFCDKGQKLDQESRRSLIGMVSTMAPVGVYALKGQATPLFVNMSTRNLSRTPNGPLLEDDFLFYPEYEAIRLHRLLLEHGFLKTVKKEE